MGAPLQPIAEPEELAALRVERTRVRARNPK